MKKSAIVTTVLTVLFLVCGIGLIVFGMNGGLMREPQVYRYQDDWSLFSMSYSWYSTSTGDWYMTEKLIDIGRTLVTCGVVMLGFTFVLQDRKELPKNAPKGGNGKKDSYTDAQYENVKAEVKSESSREGDKKECHCANEEKHSVPDPDQVIEL